MQKLIIQSICVLGLIFVVFYTPMSEANIIPWRDGLTTFEHREIGPYFLMKEISLASSNERIFKVGNHQISLQKKSFSISIQNKIIFSSVKNKAFFIAANKTPRIATNRFGAAYIKEKMGKRTCTEQTIKNISYLNNQLILEGNLYGKKCFVPYKAIFSEKENGALNIELSGQKDDQALWLGIHGNKYEDESFFGGGEQFSELNLNGHLIPFLTQEQGHGRSRYWTSLPFDLVTRGLSGGDRFSSYIPIPMVFSNQANQKWRSLKIRGPQYSLLDLREKNSIKFWSLSEKLEIEMDHACSPIEMVTKVAKSVGLPHHTPEWFYEGAVLGGFLEGEKNVYDLLDIIDQYEIPTKALWIEDWSGIDKTIDGSRRLKWNWEIDRTLYPNWEEMTKLIKSKGIRIGGYLNPLARELKKEDIPHHNLNMMEQLKRKGLLIKNFDEEVYADLGLIKAYFVDLLNPQGYDELESILKEHFLPAGIQFWNADFSEALPLQTNYVLKESDGIAIRHRYITQWAKFNRDFINKHMSSDAVAFIRSGHTESLQYNQMYWQGDQLTTFDKEDGLYSTTIAGITSGLSGILVNHSDVGGAIKYLNLKRSKVLMHRWMEKETFGALLRTKEGMGSLKLSVFKDQELLESFSKWAQIFHKLFPYRKQLILKAEQEGLPVIRAMFLHYPEDLETYKIDDQFFFGEDMLVAPIHSKKTQRSVYFPRGTWTHFMTGKSYTFKEGSYRNIKALIGCPAVFYKKSNQMLDEISKDIQFKFGQSCH